MVQLIKNDRHINKIVSLLVHVSDTDNMSIFNFFLTLLIILHHLHLVSFTDNLLI